MNRQSVLMIVLDKIERPEGSHPFHLRITTDEARKLGVSEECEQFIGVLYNYDCDADITKKIERGLFVTVNVINNNTADEFNKSNEIIAYATEAFFHHYFLNSEGTRFLFTPINPVPLDRIVIGARTQSAFTWAQNENWNLTKTLECGKVLCRTGDIPLLAYDISQTPNLMYDLITLECSPVSQGIMTVNTSVLVVKLTPNMLKQSKQEVTRDINSYLNLMNFTSRLLMLNQIPLSLKSNSNDYSRHVMKSFATSNAALKILRNNKCFRVEITPKEIKSLGEAIDLHNTIFLNPEEVSRQDSEIRDWIFVKLKRPDYDEIDDMQDRERDHSWRLVNVRFDPQLTPETVRVSPQLWFNLNKHPSPLLQPDCQLVFKATKDESRPLYAKEVYLALIHSPNYSVTQNYDNLLKEYFKITRCLKVGDVIALSLRGKIREYSVEIFNNDYSFCPTVYFVVTRIELDPDSRLDKELCYRVDSNNSKLYHTGTKENYVPVTMETFYSSKPFDRLLDVPIPPGPVGRVRNKLCSIISPFLKSKKLRERISINVLLSGPIGCGKKLAINAVCRSLNLHLYSIDCQEVMGEAAGATETRLRNSVSKGLKSAPVILHLENVSALSRDRKEATSSTSEDPRTIGNLADVLGTLSGPGGESNWPVIVIATTNSSVEPSGKGEAAAIHPDLASLFLHHIHLGTPNEEDRVAILEALLPPDVPDSISLTRLAQKTAGFTLSELRELVTLSTWKAFKRVEEYLSRNNLQVDECELGLAGIPSRQTDLDDALENLQSSRAKRIGAPEIPNVRWQDVGGLEEVKKEILNTIQLPLNHPELIQTGLRRSGVLLHGPPGTGKTLLAKAVATECSLNFLSVKGPELINMYVGQSEENVREVFHRARTASPCVIFFDELDSLAPNRGLSGDSGGVMDRVVSQLLAELDGINQQNGAANIFVIGATNRVDLLDPALLRPGRFDRLVKLDVAKTSQERLRILSALTRKMPLASDVNLEDLEGVCPQGLTGADFYSLCSDAQNKSLERCIRALETGQIHEDDVKAEIQMIDFTSSLETLVPSIND